MNSWFDQISSFLGISWNLQLLLGCDTLESEWKFWKSQSFISGRLFPRPVVQYPFPFPILAMTYRKASYLLFDIITTKYTRQIRNIYNASNPALSFTSIVSALQRLHSLAPFSYIQFPSNIFASATKMVLCRVMNTWVFLTLISLLAGVQARSLFHPTYPKSNSSNPLGRHRDWKLPLGDGMSLVFSQPA